MTLRLKRRSWAHRIRIGLLLGVPILVLGCSCSSEGWRIGTDGNDLAKAIHSGFEPPPSRLFVSSGGMWRLTKALGYDPSKYTYYRDHSSDGTSLRCWNMDQSEAVVFRVGESTRLLKTRRWAYIDDGDREVAWGAGDFKVTFPSGKTLYLPGFHLSSGGQFFCCDNTSNASYVGMQIASVDEPDRPLITSPMKGILEGIYVRGDVVYVIARSDTGTVLNDLVCEEYARKKPGLVFVRRFNLHSPNKFGVNFVPEDFDPESGMFLLSVGFDMPIGGTIHYVYDIKTGQYRNVGKFERYAGFLDRKIFNRALEEVSTLTPAR